nr:DUF3365 domain-containing protein [Parasulfuritortus cantonensis]
MAACVNVSSERQAQYTTEARATAGEFAKTLGGELKAAMKGVGPEGAITVCKDRAPAIAAEVAQEHGVGLRRVTFKSRNPASVPDPWETRVLHDFERRLARGESAANLEYSEVIREGDTKTFRYMKGLVVQEICMTCHGTPETIPDGVKAKLAAEYPTDQATGYLPNMLRGAISVKKPL